MKSKLHRWLLSTPGRRYIVIGIAVYVLELLAIVVAQALGATPVVAVAVSYWVGFVVSFLMQKLVTFRDKRVHHKVIVPQLIAVGLLVLFNFGFTIVATKILSNVLPAVVIRTLALGVTTIWNYYLYHTRIFKSSEEMIF